MCMTCARHPQVRSSSAGRGDWLFDDDGGLQLGWGPAWDAERLYVGGGSTGRVLAGDEDVLVFNVSYASRLMHIISDNCAPRWVHLNSRPSR